MEVSRTREGTLAGPGACRSLARKRSGQFPELRGP